MIKSDLITKIAYDTNLNLREVSIVYDKIIKYICEYIVKGDFVYLKHLGTFKVKVRRARKVMNPRTKTTKEIPDGAKLHFKVSSILNDKIMLMDPKNIRDNIRTKRSKIVNSNKRYNFFISKEEIK